MEQPSLFPLEEYTQPVSEPEFNDAFVFALGSENALAVVLALGGISLQVPSQPSGGVYSFLEEKLGKDLAQLMVSKFGGEDLYISRRYSEAVRARHKAVIDIYLDFRKGNDSQRLAVQQTALKMGVSERHVYRILSANT